MGVCDNNVNCPRRVAYSDSRVFGVAASAEEPTGRRHRAVVTMAFEKGPGEGYGAWGRVEVLERFPNAICKLEIHPRGLVVYRVYEEPGGLPVGTAWSA